MKSFVKKITCPISVNLIVGALAVSQIGVAYAEMDPVAQAFFNGNESMGLLVGHTFKLSQPLFFSDGQSKQIGDCSYIIEQRPGDRDPLYMPAGETITWKRDNGKDLVGRTALGREITLVYPSGESTTVWSLYKNCLNGVMHMEMTVQQANFEVLAPAQGEGRPPEQDISNPNGRYFHDAVDEGGAPVSPASEGTSAIE